jgi:hypothetical protein
MSVRARATARRLHEPMRIEQRLRQAGIEQRLGDSREAGTDNAGFGRGLKDV